MKDQISQLILDFKTNVYFISVPTVIFYYCVFLQKVIGVNF